MLPYLPLAAFVLTLLCCCAYGEPRLVVCCDADNDLPAALLGAGDVVVHVDSPEAALEVAATGDAVLVLADGYPEATTALPEGLFEQARARDLRLYVEYPASLPGLDVGAPQGTKWERGVVASDFFGPALPGLQILAIHDCRYVPVAADRPHLVAARVAGFDSAVYGLPDDARPILFEHPDFPALVATTKLSQFVTAQYAPTESWRGIWRGVLGWLCRGAVAPEPEWTPTVRPSFGRDDALPGDVEAVALGRGASWFLRSGLLATRSDDRELAPGVTLPPLDTAAGDGTHGILEGFSGAVKSDGTQHVLGGKRSDCNGESAMALAFGGALGGEEEGAVATGILDYWLERSGDLVEEFVKGRLMLY